jgi:transposase
VTLKTSKAWFIIEAFRFFWVVPKSSAEAEEYLEEWYRHTIYSKLEPMKKVARMLKERLGNGVTRWRHPITNAVSEGLNRKIQRIKSSARGSHSFASYRIRILFFCGKLDLKPHLTHSIER